MAIWALNDDDPSGRCGQGPYPLTRTISQAFQTMAEQTNSKSFRPTSIGSNANRSLFDILEKYGNIERILEEEADHSEIQSLSCPSQPIYEPLNKDCSTFYRCVRMPSSTGLVSDFASENAQLRFKYSCPPGLVFDRQLQLCNFPSWSNSCPNSGEVASVQPSEFQCEQPGFFQNTANCEYFYYCSNRLAAFQFKCPFDLGFDQSLLQCNWKWLISGCGLQTKPNTGSEEEGLLTDDKVVEDGRPRNNAGSAEEISKEEQIFREQLLRLSGQEYLNVPSGLGANGLGDQADLERMAAAASEPQPVHIRQTRSVASSEFSLDLEHREQKKNRLTQRMDGWLSSVRNMFGTVPLLANPNADQLPLSVAQERFRRQDASWFSQLSPFKMAASKFVVAVVPPPPQSSSNKKRPKLSNVLHKAFHKRRPSSVQTVGNVHHGPYASLPTEFLSQSDFLNAAFPIDHLHPLHLAMESALSPMNIHPEFAIRPAMSQHLRNSVRQNNQLDLQSSHVHKNRIQPTSNSAYNQVTRKNVAEQSPNQNIQNPSVSNTVHKMKAVSLSNHHTPSYPRFNGKSQIVSQLPSESNHFVNFQTGPATVVVNAGRNERPTHVNQPPHLPQNSFAVHHHSVPARPTLSSNQANKPKRKAASQQTRPQPNRNNIFNHFEFNIRPLTTGVSPPSSLKPLNQPSSYSPTKPQRLPSNVQPSVNFVSISSPATTFRPNNSPVANQTSTTKPKQKNPKPNMTIQNEYHIVHSNDQPLPSPKPSLTPSKLKKANRPSTAGAKPRQFSPYNDLGMFDSNMPSAFIAQSSPVRTNNLLIIPVPDDHPKAQSLEEIQKLIQYYPELFPVSLQMNGSGPIDTSSLPNNQPNVLNTEYYVLSVDANSNTRTRDRPPIKLEEYLKYDLPPKSNKQKNRKKQKVTSLRNNATTVLTSSTRAATWQLTPKTSTPTPYSAFNHIVIPLENKPPKPQSLRHTSAPRYPPIPSSTMTTQAPTTNVNEDFSYSETPLPNFASNTDKPSKVPVVIKLELPHSQPEIVDEIFEKVKDDIIQTTTSLAPDRPVYISISTPVKSHHRPKAQHESAVTPPTNFFDSVQLAPAHDSNPDDPSKVYLLGKQQIPKQVFDTLKQVISDHVTNDFISSTTPGAPAQSFVSTTTERSITAASPSTVYGTRTRRPSRKNFNQRRITKAPASAISSTTPSSVGSYENTSAPSSSVVSSETSHRLSDQRKPRPTSQLPRKVTFPPRVSNSYQPDDSSYGFSTVRKPHSEFESNFDDHRDLFSKPLSDEENLSSERPALWNQKWPPNRSYLSLLDEHVTRQKLNSTSSDGESGSASSLAPAFDSSYSDFDSLRRDNLPESGHTLEYLSTEADSSPHEPLMKFSISSFPLQTSNKLKNQGTTASYTDFTTISPTAASTLTTSTTTSTTTTTDFSTNRRQKPWIPNRFRSSSNAAASPRNRHTTVWPFASRTTQSSRHADLINTTTVSSLHTSTDASPAILESTNVPHIYNQQNVNVYIVPGASGNLHLRTTSRPVALLDLGLNPSASAPYEKHATPVSNAVPAHTHHQHGEHAGSFKPRDFVNHNDSLVSEKPAANLELKELIDQLPTNLRPHYVKRLESVSQNNQIPESACAREGLFQHPLDCNKFYQCVFDAQLNRFSIASFECPVKIAFDNRIIGCSSPSDPTVCIQY